MIQFSANAYTSQSLTLFAKIPIAIQPIVARVAQIALLILTSKVTWIVIGVIIAAMIIIPFLDPSESTPENSEKKEVPPPPVSKSEIETNDKTTAKPSDEASAKPSEKPSETVAPTDTTAPETQASAPEAAAPAGEKPKRSLFGRVIATTRSLASQLAGPSSPAYPNVMTDLPPPPSHITQGCQNLGATCWFNSSLNLMAGTTYFDALLNADFTNAGDSEDAVTLRALVPVLKIAVNELRSGRPLNTDLARTCRQAIQETGYMRTTNEGGSNDATVQHDAADFIVALLGGWESISVKTPLLVAPPSLPHVTATFKPVGHTDPKTDRTDRESILYAPLAPLQVQLRTPVFLHRALKPRDIDENVSDMGIRRTYCAKKHIDLNNTERLIVSVARTQYNGTRAGNLIEINFDGTVKLTGLKKAESTYAVKAALIQSGGTNSGHWYYVEANADGKFYEHNDTRVAEVPQGSNDSLREAGINKLRTGTIFFLEKVQAQVV